MAKVALTGIGTDDDGNVFADSNSPVGQQVLQQFGYPMGMGMGYPMGGMGYPMGPMGGANIFQTAAGAFQALTGFLDQDTANTLRKDLEKQRDEIDGGRRLLAVQLEDPAIPAPIKRALEQVSEIDRRQNLALETEIELAKLQRRSALNSGISGGINLAGQFVGPGGGLGGPGFGYGGLGWAGPAALGGLAGYALGRNSSDDDK